MKTKHLIINSIIIILLLVLGYIFSMDIISSIYSNLGYYILFLITCFFSFIQFIFLFLFSRNNSNQAFIDSFYLPLSNGTASDSDENAATAWAEPEPNLTEEDIYKKGQAWKGILQADSGSNLNGGANEEANRHDVDLATASQALPEGGTDTVNLKPSASTEATTEATIEVTTEATK